MLMTCGLASGALGSYTLTWERPETQTKADWLWAPAKTISVGSSPTSIVRVTLPAPRSTMLTESDSQFVTQASLLLRAATLTGSSPVGISLERIGVAPVKSNTDRLLVGLFTTSKRVPSGVIHRG